VKANSSRWVHEKRDPEFAWRTGSGVFSMSESNVAAVTKYVASPQEHHQEPFVPGRVRSVSEKQQRSLDGRYIWD
jgi:hypothetical protein